MLGEVDGLTTFEGVLRANLEAVGGADCCREDSDTVKGVCNLENGDCGTAEIGGVRLGRVMLTSMSRSCEQLGICSAIGTKAKHRGQTSGRWAVYRQFSIHAPLLILVRNRSTVAETNCSRTEG